MTGPVLTNSGFAPPTLAQVTADLNAKFQANVRADIDLSPDQPFGQIIAIFAQKIYDAHQLGATAYNGIDPSNATGQLLANIAAISGTIPQVATYSTVSCNLTLGAAVTVPAGSVVAVLNQPGNTWVLTAPVTSTTAGTYAGLFRSSVPGPFAAGANSVSVISTPVIGWTAVTNPLAAVQGLPADTDTTLRQKRVTQLAGQGSGDTDAIRAAVLKVPGVLQAFVYENTTMVTDATGLPGKSFRVVVWDGVSPPPDSAAIAAAIWAEKPAAVQAFGSVQVQTPDSAGTLQTVSFDRAIQVPLYVTCTTTPAVTGANAVAVGQALAAFIAALPLGAPVIAVPFRTAALLPGITTDVPTFFFDKVPSPSNTANLPISTLQIATLATGAGFISVNGIPV